MSDLQTVSRDFTVDAPVLEVEDLQVSFATENETVDALKGISYSVGRGEILALVGESGSGKSVSTRSIMRLLPQSATASGAIRVGKVGDVFGASTAELRAMRGSVVSMIFQEPSAALDPVYRIGTQIVESLRLHTSMSRKEAWARAVGLLERVGIPEPQQKAKMFPHQLSGGQKQRVIIAIAIALEPSIIIADEPTTALDVTVQAEILDLLCEMRDRIGTAILLITHNMGVVADVADRVVVLRQGEEVESGPVHDLLTAPAHAYTKELLASVPSMHAPQRQRHVKKTELALQFDEVSVTYPGGFGREPVKAVRDVSLSVEKGEMLGLVGESGSGKSTLTNLANGLLPPTQGRVLANGTDLHSLDRKRTKEQRRNLGMVFQDPRASLNPRSTVYEAVAAPMAIHGVGTEAEKRRRVDEMLEAVALPQGMAARYPHELSGGQRQRVSIARALVLSPSLVLADEPTSALDVSVQASILALVRQLQDEFQFACLFITHDLAVVSEIAHRVAVMRRGRLIETGLTAQVLSHPTEEYTANLVAAIPVADPVEQRKKSRERRSRR